MAVDNSNNSAFEKLFLQHYSRLFTLALRMAGRRDVAEEILQEAFLSAFTHFGAFRHESSPFTWLYRIVLNEGKKRWREEQRLPIERYAEEHDLTQAEVYDHINSFGSCEDEALVSQVRENCLQIFMNCMPPAFRAVYTLRQILCFDSRETARILEINENTVNVNLNRARKIVAEHLQGRCSLTQKNALCDCRLYAAYLNRVGKRHLLIDIEVIRQKEQQAKEELARELREILQIDSLYHNEIRPPDYEAFAARVKALRADKSLKILQYK